MLLVPSIPAAAKEIAEGTDNFSYTFDGANVDDGGTMTTDANGKTKVIVFFKVDCGHCQQVLYGIANSSWIHDAELADVYAIAMDQKTDKNTGKLVSATVDDVKDFRTQWCSNANGRIQFGMHAQASSAMFRYGRAAGLVDEIAGTIGTPVVAIVDAENKLRDVTSGSAGVVDAMQAKLEAFKPSNPGNPDDSGNTDNPDNSGDSNNPDNPDDSQKPEQPEQPGTEESSNYQPACNHRTESVLVSSATASSDAVAISKCVKCGAVLSYEKVANSAYHTFLKETADAIANAQQPTVVIDAKMWVSFNRTVFEAIKSRPDVAVTVNYSYEGQKYVLQIPAGVNVDTLMDENGFGGFRYIDKVLNTKD